MEYVYKRQKENQTRPDFISMEYSQSVPSRLLKLYIQTLLHTRKGVLKYQHRILRERMFLGSVLGVQARGNSTVKIENVRSQ